MTTDSNTTKDDAPRKPRSGGFLRVVRTQRPDGAVAAALQQTHLGIAHAEQNLRDLLQGLATSRTGARDAARGGGEATRPGPSKSHEFD